MKIQKTVYALYDVSRELRALSHLFENQNPSVPMVPNDMDVVFAGLANILERYHRRVKRSAVNLEQYSMTMRNYEEEQH
jgi:hypothetical protein